MDELNMRSIFTENDLVCVSELQQIFNFVCGMQFAIRKKKENNLSDVANNVLF